MGVSTFSAAVHITPTVVKTLIKHVSRKSSKFARGTAEEDVTDDILYDEAFNIVKSFIELGTLNTVESLQKFTNTHIISPPWAAVVPVLIPLSSCNDAADLLIDWFSPNELKKVVGGERWWQVRGLDGIDAEWVADKKTYSQNGAGEERIKHSSIGKKLSDDDKETLRMESLEKVLLYIHGGAYFWGSINTHRYQIIKYSRKIKGRAFAVNYRKAPQYPWPCPLQDVLAAYLYLTKPPKSALHKPVPASRIVLAGDSAGGGLALSLLTLLRDLDQPLPAGAVLISPWVDLTHSFPSVMNNITKDIIPVHGFIHKPSVVWPIDVLNRHGRVKETRTPPPPKPGHADTLKPSSDRISKDRQEKHDASANSPSREEITLDLDESLSEKSKPVVSASEEKFPAKHLKESREDSEGTTVISSSEIVASNASAESYMDDDSWEPKPPKVLMDDPSATPLELGAQIQLYATNEQLTHPLVSPVLNGSLGNLCPLYIITGDHEALRDEIVYIAHRAAYPDRFPARSEATRESHRQEENAKRFKTPTKVHLQVFDGMCHVLTVFTFHTAVKYAYRSIAEFVDHVTSLPAPQTQTQVPVFPELKIEEVANSPSSVTGSSSDSCTPDRESSGITSHIKPVSDGLQSVAAELSLPMPTRSRGTEELFEENMAATKEQMQENADANEIASEGLADSDDDREAEADGANPPSKPDFSKVIMIRQRVDIHGHVRQMEPIEDIPALRIDPNEIGLLREAPARRWQDGQRIWDEKFKSAAKKVQKQRKKNEDEYMKMLERAKELGLRHVNSRSSTLTAGSGATKIGVIQDERRWGPLDLPDDNPPPSAIAARKDTPDALALLRKTVYHTAPRTIRRLPKRKAKDVVKAAFDPADDPKAPPRQSVSEQQRRGDLGPIHGLKIWAYLMGYFGERSSHQAAKGKKKATSGAKKASRKLRIESALSKTGLHRSRSDKSAEGKHNSMRHE